MKNINLNNDELSMILSAINRYKDRLDEAIEKELKQKKVRVEVVEALNKTDEEYKELRTKILEEMD